MFLFVVLMKAGLDLRNKTAAKRLKMAIFKLLVLSYMYTSLYILVRKRNAKRINTFVISFFLCVQDR